MCRVCHGESEAEHPLFHPCKCSGSIKYVHQDCLLVRKELYYVILNTLHTLRHQYITSFVSVIVSVIASVVVVGSD